MNEHISLEGSQSVDELAIERILIPTDLSPVAARALDFGLDIARRTGARVDVLAVLGQLLADPFNPIHYSPEASAERKSSMQLVQDVVNDLLDGRDVSGIRVTSSVHRGPPVRTILGAARRARTDLLVIGTHDRHAIEYMLAGSSAEEIVRRAPMSVLVIHDRDAQIPTEVGRILVPVDLSDTSEHLLRAGSRVAQLFDAEMDVLHVVEPIPVLDGMAGAMTMRDVVPDMRRYGARALEQFTGLVALPAGVRTYVDEGRAESCIMDRALKSKSDLIVVGRGSRTAVERFFIGSVTERVVRYAPCPVLVVSRRSPSTRN